jgi:repressor of nif and glnA expression
MNSKEFREWILQTAKSNFSLCVATHPEWFGCAVIMMGWDEETEETQMRRVRYHLNKLVKEGKLEKSRQGAGRFAVTDFGFRHANVYVIPQQYI